MFCALLSGIPAPRCPQSMPAQAVAVVTAGCAVSDTNPSQGKRHWQFHTGHGTTPLTCFYGQGTQTLNCQVPLRMQNATLKKAKGKQFWEKKRMEISIIQQHWQKTNPGSGLLCTALFMPMLVAAPVGIRSTTNCLFPWMQRAVIATDHADRAHCLHLNGNDG